MLGEFLSIETSKRIAKLEKENNQLSDMVWNFDKEVNRLWSLIKKIYEYTDKEIFSEVNELKSLQNMLSTYLNQNIEEYHDENI